MPDPKLRPAVFLDRDGVLIENRADYVKSIAETCFLPGAVEAVARLARRPWPIVFVTNQAGIAKGLIPRETAEAINALLVARITAAGGRVDGVYVCPHHPAENCACRKPQPGLLLQAAAALGLDLAASVLIGDSATDAQAARAAGVRPIFLRTGLPERLAAEEAKALTLGATVYSDLAGAVAALLRTAE